METKSVALIVSALATGVALSGTDAASPAVDDAYARLKALVRERLGGNSDAELALARLEQALEAWRILLMAELERAAGGRDPVLEAAAMAVQHLAGKEGTLTGKYTVDVQGARGALVGDLGTQVNVYTNHVPVTKQSTLDRLELGFNAFSLRLELAASGVDSAGHLFPAADLAGFILTVNETFNLSLGPMPSSIAPGQFMDYFMKRMRPRDALGAAVFRLGAELSAWWQTKGIHGEQMDALLEGNVESALDELAGLRPESKQQVQEVMKGYRHRDTRIPDDRLTLEFLKMVALAIAEPET